MITKDSAKEQVHALKGARLWGKIGLMHLVEGGLILLLCALCASAQVFGRCSPFGLAFVAVAGAGFAGFAALIGAVGGYLFFGGLDGGLHYLAAAVLGFGICFAVYDTKLYHKPSFMPAVMTLLGGICRAFYLWGLGFGAAEVIFFATELALIFGASYAYRAVFSIGREARSLAKLSRDQQLALAALGGTVLLALDGVRLMGEFSIGHIAAVVVVMLAARQGAQTGLVAGVVAGLVMDMGSGHTPYYSMMYAISGAVCGIFARRSKLSAALSYVLAGGVAVLWTWESGMRIGLLYEVFAASVLFMLVPRRLLAQSGGLLALQAPSRTADWQAARETAVRHVRDTAKAFREIYDGIRESIRPPKKGNGEDPAVIFQCAAERECRKCKLRELCWQQEYQSTQQQLVDALRPMLARGKAESDDFAGHFRSRCIHFVSFLAVVNEELSALLHRRQYQGRLDESRAALCRQYADLDRILAKAAMEISAEFTPDLPREAKLRQFLRAQALADEGKVYFDGAGHLRVETPPAAYLRTEEAREALGKTLSITLRKAQEMEGGLYFTQAEPYRATAGVFGRSKAGENISGDTGTWFRRDDGLLCILLCDGMGSGAEARVESDLAVRLLQSFLKAGVEPEAALATVNDALALRAEEGGGCTTVDLLTVELYTGLCTIYKLGAAPSYLRRGGVVSALRGRALPVGLARGEEQKPDIERFRLAPGDWVLLLSDGMLLREDDTWLREALESYEGKSPGELAEKLLALSLDDGQGADDASVIAVRLEKRSG